MRRAIAVHPRGTWPEAEAADTVTLAYLDRHRRRIRLVADSGEAFLLDLAAGAASRPMATGSNSTTARYVGVRAAPEPVLEIEAADRAACCGSPGISATAICRCRSLGERLRIRADHVIAEMVAGLGGRLTRLDAPFDPEIGAYAGAPHRHLMMTTTDDGRP